MPVRVATADETVACERATIAAGTPAAALMQRAGAVASGEIASRYALALGAGVTIYAGPGNNGGDGWVVARHLADRGCRVMVLEAGTPGSTEAAAAREHALENEKVSTGAIGQDSAGDSAVVIDALLGTGFSGEPRGAVAQQLDSMRAAAEAGAAVVALDLPSGLDATTGAYGAAVPASLTLSFGVVKRGQLLARELCGEILALDIGLASSSELDALPLLVDRSWVSHRIPAIPPAAHKGTRKRIAVIGGGAGMAGAAILAGKGALRSGAGLVRLVVHGDNVAAAHGGLPEALVSEWPVSADSLAAILDNTDALALGPGLGSSTRTRDLVERVLLAWRGPVVVDADALNVFAGDAGSLGRLLSGRTAVVTPHPAELARLIGLGTDSVVQQRFSVGADLASASGAAVLLKGAPTVVFGPGGTRLVSAAGTAALATGGSGDVLSGMIATLLAQTPAGGDTAAEIAATAAFVHGRAAELCGPVRGATLEDVLLALQESWNEPPDAELDEHGSILTRIPALP